MAKLRKPFVPDGPVRTFCDVHQALDAPAEARTAWLAAAEIQADLGHPELADVQERLGASR